MEKMRGLLILSLLVQTAVFAAAEAPDPTKPSRHECAGDTPDLACWDKAALKHSPKAVRALFNQMPLCGQGQAGAPCYEPKQPGQTGRPSYLVPKFVMDGGGNPELDDKGSPKVEMVRYDGSANASDIVTAGKLFVDMKQKAKDELSARHAQKLLRDTTHPASPYNNVVGDRDVERGDGFLLGADGKLKSAHLIKEQKTGTRDIQERLRSAGFGPGKIDGLDGPRTTRAIKRFQRAFHLPVTGVADQLTRNYLGQSPKNLQTLREAYAGQKPDSTDASIKLDVAAPPAPVGLAPNYLSPSPFGSGLVGLRQQAKSIPPAAQPQTTPPQYDKDGRWIGYAPNAANNGTWQLH